MASETKYSNNNSEVVIDLSANLPMANITLANMVNKIHDRGLSRTNNNTAVSNSTS